MHYHNVLAFFVEKCKVFDLYPPAAYLFSSLWIANINYFNYIQLFCTSQNEEVIRQWYFLLNISEKKRLRTTKWFYTYKQKVRN